MMKVNRRLKRRVIFVLVLVVVFTIALFNKYCYSAFQVIPSANETNTTLNTSQESDSIVSRKEDILMKSPSRANKNNIIKPSQERDNIVPRKENILMKSPSRANKNSTLKPRDNIVPRKEEDILASDENRKSSSGLGRSIETSKKDLLALDGGYSSLVTHLKVNYSAMTVNSSEHAIGDNDLRILFWTPWLRSKAWWEMPHTSLVTCGDITCQFTHDRSLYNQSDAVLFYFYQGRIGAHKSKCFPQNQAPNQHWVAYFDGPPTYLSMKNMSEVGKVFNLTSSHHQKSDIHVPFGICEKVPGEHLKADYAAGKRGLVSWFVSHCNTHNGRENYVKQLKKFIPIDIRGKCSGRRQCKMNLQSDSLCPSAISTMNSYKFYLSFENSNCVDYITEKVYKVLVPGMATVPIIMSGVTNLKEILPPHSFIDARSFESPEELAKFLLMLDNNDKLYNQYFAWRSAYKCGFNWRARSFCCNFAKLHGEKKLVTNVSSIFGAETCEESAPTYSGLHEQSVRSAKKCPIEI